MQEKRYYAVTWKEAFWLTRWSYALRAALSGPHPVVRSLTLATSVRAFRMCAAIIGMAGDLPT